MSRKRFLGFDRLAWAKRRDEVQNQQEGEVDEVTQSVDGDDSEHLSICSRRLSPVAECPVCSSFYAQLADKNG